MNSVELKETTRQSDAFAEERSVAIRDKATSFLKENSWLFLVVGAALTSALLFHFVFGHPKTTLSYDARSYLWTSARFAQFLVDLSHFQWSPQLICDAQFREHVINDGPLYTSFIGSCFALFQQVPVAKDWYKIEIIQSIVHGLSSGFIYLIALRLLKTRQGDGTGSGALQTRLGAVAAGLIWAFYPPANVASGFLFTEPFVVFAIVAFVWAAVAAAGRIRDAAAGFFAGLVFLLKPALIPAACVSLLARLIFSPKKLPSLITIAAALTLTVAPWALWTQLNLGKMQITTPRFGGYNLAMGSDLETDGRLAIPCTPMTNIYRDDEKPIFFVASQWKFHTIECLQMTSRKLTRLLSFPYNDYRQPYMGLDAVQQRILHVALLFFGLAGCLLAAITRRVERASMPVLVVMAFMWSPLVYLMFESNSRYGFTIMPMYAVFAGYLIGHVSLLSRMWKAIALSAVAAGLLTAAIVQAGVLGNPGASVETRVDLEPQQVLTTCLDLKNIAPPGAPYEALIIVDGERDVESASLRFNGRKVKQPLEHLRYFDSGVYDGYYVTKEIAHCMGSEAEDFRQWRVARIPSDWLNWSGKNEIEITPGRQGGTIYGDSHERVELLPSFRHYCPNKLFNSVSGYETRLAALRPSRNTAQESTIAPAAGKVPGSTRVRLAIVLDAVRHKNRKQSVRDFAIDASGVSSQTLIYDQAIRPEQFPLIMRNARGDGTIQTNRFVLDHVAPAIEIKLPPPSPGDNVLRIKLTGQVRSTRPGRVSALVANDKFAVLSKTPPHMNVDANWKTFEIDDRMPVRLLKGKDGKPTLAVALYPGPWLDESGYGASKASSDAMFRNLNLSVWSLKQLDTAGKQVFVY